MTETQKFERDAKRSYDVENWQVCELAYAQSGLPTVHINHKHGKRDIIRHWMIKSDLSNNRCRALIKKEYWAS